MLLNRFDKCLVDLMGDAMGIPNAEMVAAYDKSDRADNASKKISLEDNVVVL